jgi:GntR family transcriptional regulator
MSKPMYRTVAESLRQQIESGQLLPGAKLPTETALQETYGASRNTVRDAIKWLMNLDLVETRPGHGTFVTRKIDPLTNFINLHTGDESNHVIAAHASSRSRRASVSTPRVEIQTPNTLVRSQLRLQDDVQLVSRHQQCLIDDTPWSLHTAFYPMDLVIRGGSRLLIADNIPTGTLAYLSESMGIRPETWRVWITCRLADQNEARYFGLRADRPAVVETFQTYYDQTGTPFCLAVTAYAADRNLFQVTVGSVPSLNELPIRLEPYMRPEIRYPRRRRRDNCAFSTRHRLLPRIDDQRPVVVGTEFFYPTVAGAAMRAALRPVSELWTLGLHIGIIHVRVALDV